MKFSKRNVIIFILTLFMMVGAGFLIYILNADVFFALGWFVLLFAILSHATAGRARWQSKLIIWIGAVILAGIWVIFNEKLFLLISTSVNSNPYGEYFLGQFEFRLLLSIFVLKAILKMWLTDARLLIAAILLVLHVAVVAPSVRVLLRAMPGRIFEFVVYTGSLMSVELRRYLSVSFSMAIINSLLWCLAAFLLQFDNFILMTFIMLLFSFIPRLGLFVGAALSLLFVESGLFLIQLGGMLIALASIWFVDHTFVKDQDLLDKTIPLPVVAVLPAAGFVGFSFWGLFLAAPVFYAVIIVARNIAENSPLIHKKNKPIPRKA